jgi:hypothetical protein
MINPKKRKPLGKPIEWADDDLTQLSTITATDKKAAAALWKNEAPVRFKSLLEATVEEKQQ